MSRLPSWLLPVVLVLALAVGLLTLVQQRLDEGDSYAQYSTFRADPFGTKALFLALRDLPDRPLEVVRSFRPLRRVATELNGDEPDLTGTTVLLLGEAPQQWAVYPPAARMKVIENIARQGGRVILAFEPIKSPLTEYTNPFTRDAEAKASPSPSPAPSAKPTPPVKEPDPNPRGADPREDDKAPTAEERKGIFAKRGEWTDRVASDWGISLTRVRRKPGAKTNEDESIFRQEETFSTSEAVPDPGIGAGKMTLPWLTALDFTLQASETPLWRVAFSRGRRPVVVEREFGKGTLVLVADTFFLSNEALFRERPTAAIQWLLGPNVKRVIFDEHYLGTREEPGIMTLANRFRLTGVVLGFVLLALLYVWRNASPLVPPPPDPGYEGAPPQPGLGAEAGFPSLLRRAVPGAKLAHFVFEQWKTTPSGHDHRAAPTPERVAALNLVLSEHAQAKDPAAAYRAMREKLKRKG